ncbi:MAG: M13 family metallopeptidase [Clostridiales bacterium]|nr:M13 family metallopeptidase [Clostridiales bacterium]
MKINNRILSILMTLGMSASVMMPMCLMGCSKNEKEDIKETANLVTPGDGSNTDNQGTGNNSKEIRPQDDFYGYVNAEPLRNTEIDPRYGAAGAFLECEIKKEEQLDALIDSIVTSDEEYAPGSNEQMIRDFYRQVMDYDNEKSTANQEVMEMIDKIFEINTMEELTVMSAQLLRDYNVNPFFGFEIYDGFENPTEYSLCFEGCGSVLGISLESIHKNENGRGSLDTLAYESLLACGFDEKEAKNRADELTKLAIDLSVDYEPETLSLESVSMMSSDEIREYFDADAYTEAMGFKNPYGKWCVMNEKTFSKITDAWKSEENLEAFKTWLALSVLQDFHAYISSEKVAHIYGENTMEKDEYAKQMVKGYLSSQLGELYADAYYTEETDKAVKDMCEKIRESYREVISGADWLTEDTREGLIRKLDNIEFITGAGKRHEIDPNDSNLIGKDAWESAKNFLGMIWTGGIESLKSERPRQGQSMDPQTVNACYWVDNVVRITIAIVNEPFFSAVADLSANLGGLGMVIGHEIGHAFDSNGLNWDADGYYNPEWICKEDREALKERSLQCIEYYNEYTIMGIYHVDGELTLSENFADLGSMQIITNIAKTKEERQVLFENYARIWSAIMSDVYGIAALKFDVHSPNIVRVNAVLSTCEAFYETYDIKEGDGMYVAPEKRVSRW